MQRHPIVVPLLITWIAVLGAQASDPPDSKINPQNGDIEITDAMWSGEGYNIRWVVNPGDDRRPLEVILTQHPADDLAPRLVISPAGDTWVVWWRNGPVPEVVCRKRTLATAQLSIPRRVSRLGEPSRRPSIVHDGTVPWVAYEADLGGLTGIAVTSIIDEPDPIPSRTLIGTTGYGGALDVRAHARPGHLWVTWIDSADDLGYSVYDPASGTWGPVGYEPIGAGGVDAARDRVEQALTGG